MVTKAGPASEIAVSQPRLKKVLKAKSALGLLVEIRIRFT
jgi:hypothetical protein